MAKCKVDSCQEKNALMSSFCKRHTRGFYIWEKKHKSKLSDLGIDKVIDHEKRELFFINYEKNPNILEEAIKQQEQEIRILNDMIVSTGDIPLGYDIIGPVYFSLNNSGILSSQYTELVNKYTERLQKLTEDGLRSDIARGIDWGIFYGELSFNMRNHFDQAFYISVEEIKKRTTILGGDGIIFLRQDIDLDTTHFQKFYLQMYGTAVKLHESND